jgi:hypothetical protein
MGRRALTTFWQQTETPTPFLSTRKEIRIVICAACGVSARGVGVQLRPFLKVCPRELQEQRLPSSHSRQT